MAYTDKVPFWKKDIKLTVNDSSNKFKYSLFSNLSILLSSGVDITGALAIIIENQSKKLNKSLLKDILSNVVEGNSFSDSLLKTGKFSKHAIAVVSIGEESGKLSEILQKLSTDLERRIKQKRQLVSSLTYPAFVLFTAIVAVGFMIEVIIPIFDDVFRRFQGELPPLTKSIIRISDWLSSNALLFLIVIIAFAVIIIRIRKDNWFRKFGSSLVLKMPVIGAFTTKYYEARYAQWMALLLGSGIHLLESIKHIKDLINFYPIETSMHDVELSLMRGSSYSDSLINSGALGSQITALTKVGEDSNNLSVLYEQLSDNLNNELEQQIKTLNNIIEPILIIIVGLLVAVILISMYLPLFQIGSFISQ